MKRSTTLAVKYPAGRSQSVSTRTPSGSVAMPSRYLQEIPAVTNAVQRALREGLTWPLPAELDDSRLEAMLYAPAAARSRYAQPDYALLFSWHIADELMPEVRRRVRGSDETAIIGESLAGLFIVQKFGTAKVGKVFGPVMILWFFTLAVMGVWHIVKEPSVFLAINPVHAIRFFAENGITGFLVLGAVFLVVTGGEALYADMGHFGARPIRLAWYFFVFPALLLNYFGQGAFLLHTPEGITNPFYTMAPKWALYPLVVLATMAASIASQAVISGAFSLTRQAVQLGYLPRIRVHHTSAREIGQIYIPSVNWGLMVASMGLVLTFRSATNLAAAYGATSTRSRFGRRTGP